MPVYYRRQGSYRNDRPSNYNNHAQDVVLNKILERLEKLENRSDNSSKINAFNRDTQRKSYADIARDGIASPQVQPQRGGLIVRPPQVESQEGSNERLDNRQAPLHKTQSSDYYRRLPRLRSAEQRSDEMHTQRLPVPGAKVSSNPDFRLLVRSAAGVCQLDQHSRNWSMMPISLSNRVDHFVESIRPPRPNEGLIKDLEDAASYFKEEVTSIVRKHLSATKVEIIRDLSACNHDDIDLAIGIATRQLKTRLGKRLHLPTFQTSVDQVLRNTKKATSKRPLDTSPLPTIELRNRFALLPVDEMDIEFPALPATPVVPKKTVNSLLSNPKCAPTMTSTTLRSPITTTLPVTSSTSTAQRSLITTTLPVTSSSSSSSTPVPPIRRAAVTGHRAPTAASWKTTRTEPHHTVQFVGDSNLISWSQVKLPCHFNIDSFSGCHLSDVVDILDRSSSHLTSVDTIVLAVGINDRNEPEDNIRSAFHRLEAWRSKHNKRMVFSSVPLFECLNTRQQETIDFINKTASELFKDSYVTCCNSNQIFSKGSQPPLCDIHYTSETAEIIASNIISNLN